MTIGLDRGSTPPRNRKDGRSVLIRFFWIVLAGYCVAICVVATGVWLSAQPKLDLMARDALRDKAATRARAVNDAIDLHLRQYRDHADGALVRALVLGHSDDPRDAAEALQSLDDPPHLRFAVVDYLGRPLLSSPGFSLRALRAVFSAAEVSAAIGTLDRDRPASAGVQLRNDEAGDLHALYTLPVTHGGLIEGALVIERAVQFPGLDVTPFGSGSNWDLMTDFQRTEYAQWHDLKERPVGAPIGDTGYHVVVIGKERHLRTLGWELVEDVLLATVWALALPFLGMAVFGRRVLVRPYAALAASRERLSQSQQEVAELAKIATMAHDAVLVTDAQERIVWVNPAFEGMSGYAFDQCVGRRPQDFLQGPETERAALDRIRSALDDRRPVREDLCNVRADGSRYWVSLSISPLMPEDGAPLRWVAICSDITQQKEKDLRLEEARRETEHQALHDALTGLPNRRALDLLLERVGVDSAPLTLVRIDLDHFKAVNDTHGHAAGDFVLERVAALLGTHVDPSDFAGRIGGDEFVIALGPGRRAEDGLALAERLQADIRRDMVFDGKTCRVGASFGIADSASGLVSEDGLLVAADAALYEAKERGRNMTVVYAPDIHAGVKTKRRLSMEIEEGILRQEFVPLFQPQIDARSGRIVGAEVLVRWQHPERGLLTPDQFLPLAERLSMLPDIDRIIFSQGLQAAADLERVGHALPKISFNLGAAQIEDPELLVMTDRFPLERTRIAFEILESVLVEQQSSNFRFQIDRLRERGYRIEIDDFGSGHASVVGLMQLNPDAMKIDQRLIIPITSTPRIRELVSHIVGIGQSFGISVTAEGVETQRHVDILRELGCDVLQGFHYARPLNVMDLLDMVEALGTTLPAPAALPASRRPVS